VTQSATQTNARSTTDKIPTQDVTSENANSDAAAVGLTMHWKAAMVWARQFVAPSKCLFGATAAMNMNNEPLCTNIFSDEHCGYENDALNPLVFPLINVIAIAILVCLILIWKSPFVNVIWRTLLAVSLMATHKISGKGVEGLKVKWI
jgi:hypothetical protein